MELKINTKKEESLLSRTRIECTASFQGATPSYPEMTKQIAGALKVDENVIALRNIYTSFGLQSARVIAYVYNDEASRKSIEPKIKIKDSGNAKAKKAE